MYAKTIFLFLIISAQLKAQTIFAPVGTSWNYSVTGQIYSGDLTLQYQKDTVIAGVPVKKITRAFYYTCVCPQPNIGSNCCEYYVERNDSVFLGSSASHLLYSFNNQPGDTIYYTHTGVPVKISLDSISVRNICNVNRRVLHYTKHHGNCTDSLIIIEGIGPVNDYLTTTTTQQCTVDGEFPKFKCVNLGNCSHPTASCAGLPYSVNENESLNILSLLLREKKITISRDKIIIGEIKLFDMLGKVQKKITVNGTEFEIDCSDLSPGLYIVYISDSNSIFSRRILLEN